jgi:hypothetical protein
VLAAGFGRLDQGGFGQRWLRHMQRSSKARKERKRQPLGESRNASLCSQPRLHVRFMGVRRTIAALAQHGGDEADGLHCLACRTGGKRGVRIMVMLP